MFFPVNVLLADTSEEIINACEYMKCSPYILVFSFARICVWFFRWILRMISTPISNYMDRRKVNKDRTNYLLSLDIVRVSIIDNFYRRDCYIDRLSYDVVTDELLYHDVINYAPKSDFNWDKKDNYVLNQWGIDELDKEGEVKKYFLKVLNLREKID